MHRPTPDDARCRFADSFRRRALAELYCLGLVFVFHGRNNHLRKAVTLLLVIVWGAITLGLAFDAVHVTSPPFYGTLTAIVFLILGRLWDIEFTNFAQVGISDGSTDDAEGDDE